MCWNWRFISFVTITAIRRLSSVVYLRFVSIRCFDLNIFDEHLLFAPYIINCEIKCLLKISVIKIDIKIGYGEQNSATKSVVCELDGFLDFITRWVRQSGEKNGFSLFIRNESVCLYDNRHLFQFELNMWWHFASHSSRDWIVYNMHQ